MTNTFPFSWFRPQLAIILAVLFCQAPARAAAMLAAPTLVSISPTAGNQAQTVAVVFQGTNFAQGTTTVAVSGADVTVGIVQVASASSLYATFTIAVSAAAGNRDVTVTTADGTSGTATFTINTASVPTVTAISVPNGNIGQTVNITLTGTNFVPSGTFVNAAGNGIGVSAVNVSSPTSLTATLTIAPGTTTGAHNVSVTTAAAQSNGIAFNVLAAPTLTSVAPNYFMAGRPAFVTVTGTNFTFGVTSASITGTGITIDSVTAPANNLVSTTQRVVAMTIAADAPLGPRNLTVTTPAGTTAAVSFSVVTTAGYTISTIAGQGAIVEGGTATDQSLPRIDDVARDSLGNTYLAASGANKVYKVTPAGVISTFAGTGAAANAGDGLLAVNAQIFSPISVAVDASNNVYILEGNSIRKVSAIDGKISQFAGRGTQGNIGSPAGFGGDGGPAYYALFSSPSGISFDAAGNLYVVDTGNSRIRKITPGGIISTVAGNGTFGFSGDSGQATSAQLSLFNETGKVAVDSGGNLYIPDTGNARIRKVTPAGIISTFAGTGVRGFSGDTGLATAAQFNGPTTLTFDANGNLFVSDTNNGRIRKIGTNNIINTVAGNGGFLFNGDGPDALVLQLTTPRSVVTDGPGNVYFADVESNRVRMLSIAGALSTIAGNGGVFSGDTGQATLARIYLPQGVAADINNNILIADAAFARIRSVSANTGIITTIAGTGSFTVTNSSGPATSTAIGIPFDVAAGPDGSVYIAASDVELGGTDSRIWKVLPNQSMSTIAGGSTSGFAGDDGPATAALLNDPAGLAVDSASNVYIADSENHRVRRINASDGKIVTVAGNGTAGFSGDGGPATAAQLHSPTKLAVDSAGVLYITDESNDRIRMVAADGTISSLTDATGWRAVASAGGAVFVTNGSRIFAVRPGPVFDPIAGASNTASGISGDNGPGLAASISPNSMAVTSTGAIVFSDQSANVIRKLSPVAQGSAVLAVLPLGISSRGGGLATSSSNLIVGLNPASGAESYAWSASASVATPNGGTWLSISPTSSNGPGSVTVTVDNTGLAAGVYNGSVTITSAAAVNGSVVIPVTLTVNPAIIGTNAQSLNLFASVGGFLSQSVAVFNGGIGGDISVSAAASTITPNGGNILSVTPASVSAGNANNPGRLLASINTAGLAAGTYNAAITLTAAGTNNTPVTIPVTLTLITPPPSPFLSSITPVNGSQGQTVTVTFTGGNFVHGATVAVSGTGVTVGTVTALNFGNSLTAVLTIDPGATLSARTISVTTPAGTTGTQTFTILGAPTLTSINPTGSSVGQTVNVTANGTNFPQGATALNVSGTGVTVLAVVPSNSTTARTFTLVVAPNALPGIRTVSVSTPAGTTATLNFSVTSPAGYLISNFAGQSVIAEGGIATAQPLPPPADVAIDSNGNYYLAVPNANKVFKVTPGGLVSTFAGTGVAGSAGDGLPATTAQLNSPRAVIVDSSNNVLIADGNNNRIRKVLTDGTMTTFAGTGANSFTGDGGPALFASMNSPSGLGIDSAGNVYILDVNNRRVRKVDTTGVITTVAGSGTAGFFGDGLQAVLAQFSFDTSSPKMAIDGAGNIFVPDAGNHRVRRVGFDGIVTTFAGTGTSGFSGDGGSAAAAMLNTPRSVLRDASGNLFVSDSNNNRVRKIANGAISTVAGNGGFGFNGDGATATALQLSAPLGLAMDGSGNLYIADSSSVRLRKLTPAGAISTLAGSSGVFSGEGGQAASAALYQPNGVAVDLSGNILIADSRNYRIRRVDSGGTITTIAGTGVNGFSGDGTLAINAQIGFVNDIAVDGMGNIYLTASNRVRKINVADGKINTVAGTGVGGFSGDTGAATAAQLNNPNGVAVDGAGNIYIADTNNHRVRKVNASDGKINTIAGTGTFGFSGDLGLAVSAQLNSPRKVAVDGAGNVYVADSNNSRIRRIEASDQTINTFSTFGGRNVFLDSGTVLISSNSQIQRVFADGTTVLLAGQSFGIFGDGGAALMASINVASLAGAPSGKVYFADDSDNVVRQLTPVFNGSSVLSVSPVGVYSRLGSLASTTSTLQILLNGTGTFTWSSSTSISSGPAGSQWLTIPQSASGTGGAPLVASINAFGLPVGSYNGSVTITSPQAVNSPLVVPVTLTVLPAIISTSVNSITTSATVGGSNPAAQIFNVTNGGSGAAFAVTAAAQIVTPPGGSWLTVSPGSGNTGSLSLTESFNIAGLGSGVYTANVRITSAQATNSPVLIPVTLTVNPSLGPTLTSISPSSGNLGQVVSVTLTGTNFAPAGNTLNISGTGVTAGTVGLLSGTSLYTTFSIASNATPGDHTVSVTTAGGTSGTVTFTVVAARRTRSQITSQ